MYSVGYINSPDSNMISLSKVPSSILAKPPPHLRSVGGWYHSIQSTWPQCHQGPTPRPLKHTNSQLSLAPGESPIHNLPGAPLAQSPGQSPHCSHIMLTLSGTCIPLLFQEHGSQRTQKTNNFFKTYRPLGHQLKKLNRIIPIHPDAAHICCCPIVPSNQSHDSSCYSTAQHAVHKAVIIRARRACVSPSRSRRGLQNCCPLSFPCTPSLLLPNCSVAA